MGKNQKSEKLKAAEFAASLRGQLIIGQALAYAIKYIKTLPENEQEISNMNDMEYLGKELFEVFFQMYNNSPTYKAAMEKLVSSLDDKIQNKN